MQLLTDYAFPVLGNTLVVAIDTAAVLKVLTPIWTAMPSSASRLRQLLEGVLDAARVHGHRGDEPNPARWRGNLDHILPRPSKIAAVEHHASLPYRDVPALIEQLRQRNAISARALQLIALTAVRASECLGMTWGEVDPDAKVWTVPARRMKGRRSHRVPLSDQAIAVLGETDAASERVFPVSLAALDQLRLRIGMTDTVHGLRSSFRVWCAEQTSFPAEIAEQCLAHRTGDATELAYQRSDLLAQRRQLMQAWADFIDHKSAEVIALRA